MLKAVLGGQERGERGGFQSQTPSAQRVRGSRESEPGGMGQNSGLPETRESRSKPSGDGSVIRSNLHLITSDRSGKLGDLVTDNTKPSGVAGRAHTSRELRDLGQASRPLRASVPPSK